MPLRQIAPIRLFITPAMPLILLSTLAAIVFIDYFAIASWLSSLFRHWCHFTPLRHFELPYAFIIDYAITPRRSASFSLRHIHFRRRHYCHADWLIFSLPLLIIIHYAILALYFRHYWYWLLLHWPHWLFSPLIFSPLMLIISWYAIISIDISIDIDAIFSFSRSTFDISLHIFAIDYDYLVIFAIIFAISCRLLLHSPLRCPFSFIRLPRRFDAIFTSPFLLCITPLPLRHFDAAVSIILDIIYYIDTLLTFSLSLAISHWPFYWYWYILRHYWYAIARLLIIFDYAWCFYTFRHYILPWHWYWLLFDIAITFTLH